MRRLWWVRHAPTHARAFAGWRDIPADLSDRAALARLDAHLPRGGAIVSSDLGRAVATAGALAAGRAALPPQPGLREFDFGAWDGLTFDEVAAGWPDLSRRYWEEPGSIAPPGGESWNDAAARVARTVEAVLAATAAEDVILVAHFGAILSHWAMAAGLAPREAIAQPVAPLSVTRIDRTAQGWQARSVNASV
jgi:broad specificity phosphatase PhoE